MEEFLHYHPFPLEIGQTLPGIRIGYHTYGNLNAAGDNVIWICHALTANSDVIRWWPGMVGDHRYVNPEKHFIVCANIIGSCYGSSGPLSEDPVTGKTYFSSFPVVTIRDMVKAHILLRKHLGIKQIRLLMGGSMGGYQALEWSLMEPLIIRDLFLIATSAAESAWGIAVHTAQRLAIEADPTWMERYEEAGGKGLRAARGIGILTYRNYAIMKEKQSDADVNKLDNYRASSYISYQGNKLSRRFNAYSYWLLTKAMDSHNIARNRGGDLKKVLCSITQRTLIVGITSDILCPIAEQEFLASNIPNCKLISIDSLYGHDGFMVETEKIGFCLKEWMS
ncbi:MAG TPA: homoserine O-acetyltransferase [Puia sp.]|jgi:homoserine O-acetyltransferase|nr:homoserine O-acetyltransferase [Puia sp.]